MYLVVGLGNPGEKYRQTRHNMGFLAVDYIAGQLQVNFTAGKWQALGVKTSLAGESLFLLKPQTYMNLSGQAVLGASTFFKIQPEKIVVIHDDLDMEFGRIKIVVNRGTGGHNGVRSIASLLKSNAFARIKVGIGRPDTPMPVDRYVLAKMSAEEMAAMEETTKEIYAVLKEMISGGVTQAMNKFNSRKKQ